MDSRLVRLFENAIRDAHQERQREARAIIIELREHLEKAEQLWGKLHAEYDDVLKQMVPPMA